jgi:hypothetical protein
MWKSFFIWICLYSILIFNRFSIVSCFLSSSKSEITLENDKAKQNKIILLAVSTIKPSIRPTIVPTGNPFYSKSPSITPSSNITANDNSKNSTLSESGIFGILFVITLFILAINFVALCVYTRLKLNEATTFDNTVSGSNGDVINGLHQRN